jgi:hypothetical protein
MLVDMLWCVERMVWTEVWLYWCEVNGTPPLFFWVTRVTPLMISGIKIIWGEDLRLMGNVKHGHVIKGERGCVQSGVTFTIFDTRQNRGELTSRYRDDDDHHDTVTHLYTA